MWYDLTHHWAADRIATAINTAAGATRIADQAINYVLDGGANIYRSYVRPALASVVNTALRYQSPVLAGVERGALRFGITQVENLVGLGAGTVRLASAAAFDQAKAQGMINSTIRANVEGLDALLTDSGAGARYRTSVQNAVSDVASGDPIRIERRVATVTEGGLTVATIAVPASRITTLARAARLAEVAPAARVAVESIVAKGTPLTFDRAARSWTTPEGLIYEQGSIHGNRVKHLLDHTVSNPSKSTHSIFDAGRSDVMGLVDEAWATRVGPGKLQPNGNRVWTVDMGRQVGTAGQTGIHIVVRDGTTKLITAFPR